jgi:lysine-ketoglutarate reductase/saccharopine dehydrogenase-like protein (TIGR00300 family)
MKRLFLAKGHLIDSGILTSILNVIVTEGADYEIKRFDIGKTNDKESSIEIDLICDSDDLLDKIQGKLVSFGCYEKALDEAIFRTAPEDRVVPEDFYSTANHRTEVWYEGHWHKVENQRMDGVIVKEKQAFFCRKLRDVRKGDQVLCSPHSVRLFPPERDRSADLFGFMSNDVSSERSVHVAVGRIAGMMRTVKAAGKKIVAVAGPVIVHTGGSEAFAALIRHGFIDGVLSGNALAVHDIEHQFFGTSLGVDLTTGRPTNEGHKNHMRAINRINGYGSIAAAVEAGALTTGIMHEIVKKKIPYCLAGSIRDDGPLPETTTDMISAQAQYASIIRDADMVIMMASMLHAIGTGNMLGSWVKTVCVDINPAVVTKLSDRGSAQAIGIVSDVGLFLRALSYALTES